ncbi:hypothetical protein [Helicobacter sp. 16-1353]|nr:hypothetical protein [Helicobacter sp. 16-1353]
MFKCFNRLAIITCDIKLAKQIVALNNDMFDELSVEKLSSPPNVSNPKCL